MLEEGPVIFAVCLTWQLKRAIEILITLSQLSIESVSNVIAVSPRNNICSGCLMYSSFCHAETELCKDFTFLQTSAKVMIHPLELCN